MRDWVLRSMLAGAALLGLGCGGTDPSAACEGPVTVTVQPGSPAAFTWAPTCRIHYVSVTDGGGFRWVLEAQPGQSIAAPLTYGAVPAGTVERFPAQTLAPGATYELRLLVVHPDGSDETVAQRSFQVF